MPETGYGSERFLRACDVASTCRGIEGRGLAARWERLRAGSLTLARYDRNLPALTVRLTGSPAGQMIGEHLSIRERGRFRYRSAQGVLPLATDSPGTRAGATGRPSAPTSGTPAAGFTATHTELEGWEPGLDDTRRGLLTPGPIEWWQVRGPDPEVPPIAEAIVTVDDDVALLHGLGSSAPYARWLVHTAVVEHLCGRCGVLLVNSDDAYLHGAGHQYFQRLLGYEIARLVLPRPPRARIASRWAGSRYLTASRVVTPEARVARGSNHS